MVLVDTSVWVSHFRKGEKGLVKLLEMGAALAHPFVIGELACGNLANREEILGLLHALPRAPAALNEEVLDLIEIRGLMGKGLGYIDVHLLASSILAAVPLWTLDEPLRAEAAKLNIDYGPS